MIRDTSAQDQHIATAPRAGKRKWWIAAASVLALGALFFVVPGVARLLSASASVSSASLRIAQVKRGTLTRDVSAQGRVVAAQSPTLYATAPGTVTLLVQAGDKVDKDQPLAEVDSPELKNHLAQEQATLASLQVDVGSAELDNRQKQLAAKKTIDQAQIDHTTAAREVERNERAYKAGAMPEIDVLRAKDALAKAELDVTHAQADARLLVDAGAFEEKTKRLALDRQKLLVADLARQVDLLTVRAPFAGQVGQLLVQQKANVPINTGILTVIDLTTLEVELKVPEVFAHDLAIGMPAQIIDGAQEYKGELAAVSPEVVDGQVVARVRFAADKPAGLRQNQQLTTRILIDEHPNVLMVERGSFVDSGAGRVAYVVHDGIAVRTPIQTGAMSLNAVEIVSGAKEGERIVVSGTDAFNGAEKVILN